MHALYATPQCSEVKELYCRPATVTDLDCPPFPSDATEQACTRRQKRKRKRSARRSFKYAICCGIEDRDEVEVKSEKAHFWEGSESLSAAANALPGPHIPLRHPQASEPTGTSSSPDVIADQSRR